jgi:dTDP-4-amino-4,6-dideoxygalactose transaminase
MKKKIELIDLKLRYKSEKKEILKCLNKVLTKGSLVLTKELQDFERDISSYTGIKYCLGLNSGTDALMMSLWSLGIGKGDEVITPAISFVASVGAIVHVGAKPVLVDVNEDLNINCDLIESKITKKTKAIMPVHWTGRICDMDKIKRIAKKYNLFVIEDAAQGMGSFYKAKRAGSFGEISAFSSHPLKNLNALGDGGFILTNKKKLYEKIKRYRNHGMVKRDDAEIFGVNSRLDSLNATVLSYRLKLLKGVVNKRRKNVNIYKKFLKIKQVKLPIEKNYEISSYVMFIALCENRNKLQKFLDTNGIQSLIYYGTPLHLHKASKVLGYKKRDFPVAESCAKKVLAFPIHQYLKKSEIINVCSKIKEFYEKND